MDDRYYVLNPDRTLRAVSLFEWGVAQEDRHGRIVCQSTIHNCFVSTIFLGLNHRFWGEGPPLVFETMIFGGRLDQYQWRCSTWDEAVAQHAMAVDSVRHGGGKAKRRVGVRSLERSARRHRARIALSERRERRRFSDDDRCSVCHRYIFALPLIKAGICEVCWHYLPAMPRYWKETLA